MLVTGPVMVVGSFPVLPFWQREDKHLMVRALEDRGHPGCWLSQAHKSSRSPCPALLCSECLQRPEHGASWPIFHRPCEDLFVFAPCMSRAWKSTCVEVAPWLLMEGMVTCGHVSYPSAWEPWPHREFSVCMNYVARPYLRKPK